MGAPPRSPGNTTETEGEQPPRRYWEGLPTGPGPHRSGRHRPWSRLGTLMVVIGVAEAVLVAGVVTDWFGLAPILAKDTSGGSGSPNGPNPNPFGEKVNSLVTTVEYIGNATGYFPGVDHANVCGRCPMLPTILWGRSPPQALVTVFFNITNTGNAYHEITEFTLSAAQANQTGVFQLFSMYCCAANDYDEDADLVGFVPGQTIGLEAYILATNIPSTGGEGYDLTLELDSTS